MKKTSSPAVDKDTLRSLQDQADALHTNDPAFKRAAYVEFIVVFLIAVLVAVCINLYVFQIIRVEGPSMEPTFYTGERVVAEKISYRFHPPKRGDVVICFYNKGLNEKGSAAVQEAMSRGADVTQQGNEFSIDGTLLSDRHYIIERVIKRVIGLPGETVSIEGGIMKINGETLEESAYWHDQIVQDIDPVSIPEDTVFVVGDNRNVSWDSRDPFIGPIPLRRVSGRVVWVVWPLRSFGTFEGKVA